MSNTEEYQGWSNRETWAVALHLNNTHWMYNHYQALMANIKKRENTVAEWTDEEFVRFTFETEIKEQVEEWLEAFYNGEIEHPANIRDVTSMCKDVGSLWRVDWRELAKSFLEEDTINPQSDSVK